MVLRYSFVIEDMQGVKSVIIAVQIGCLQPVVWFNFHTREEAKKWGHAKEPVELWRGQDPDLAQQPAARDGGIQQERPVPGEQREGAAGPGMASQDEEAIIYTHICFSLSVKCRDHKAALKELDDFWPARGSKLLVANYSSRVLMKTPSEIVGRLPIFMPCDCCYQCSPPLSPLTKTAIANL